VVAVINNFFGQSVTVAGLLTASDLIATTKQYVENSDEIIIPAVLFNERGYTLDGYSCNRIKKHIGIPVHIAMSVRELAYLVLNHEPLRRKNG
jgi:hypothetical protein